MRIAFVYDWLYPFSKGGVQRRVADLSRLLSDRGHSVDIYGIKQWIGPSERVTGSGNLVGIRSSARDQSENTVLRRLLFAARLALELFRRDYDVVDVQSISPIACLVASTVCRLKRTPCVVTWHEVWGEAWVDVMGRVGRLGLLVDFLIRRIGRVHVAVSEHTAEQLRRAGTQPAAILVNGVVRDLYQEQLPLDRRHGVLFLGRLVEHKNVELVAESARLLRSIDVNVVFTFIGEGPMREFLESQATDTDGLVVLGSLESDDDVAAILGRTKVLAMPSRREGSGVAALEAMAAGVPVVTIQHPHSALTDFIQDHVNGLVTEDQAASFAAALQSVLEDRELHQMLAAGARRTAESHDWQHLICDYEDFYLSQLRDPVSTPIGSLPPKGGPSER